MPQEAADTTGLGPGEIHRRSVESYAQVLEGRLEDALKLIDPEVVDHRGGTQGDHRGRDAWRQKWESMSADSAYHDVSLTIEQNVVSGDTSVNRYTLRGTHTDSGRRYEVLVMDMVRVRNGRIFEHWVLRDEDAIRHQLGL
ncbi:SnoaL-like polyketide cyclase [Actinomadura rubteroloni]|uniref:SnoaL-like polyketide cyclase n=1 Tax=Actinomadura rubteroloni TaxID=1926885 RepID=A0A2P4UL65_9ACTN|nr:nuclear transport factor 2 family protein [Actinomadura rubteroloni]POM25796.1 SnoaL-like polyketide cyclase [Actinomadura rubteroloni]